MRLPSMLLVLATTALTAPSAAAITATASAGSVSAISILKIQDLSFGAISPDADGGQVVMSPSGTRSAAGGSILSSLLVGYPARFQVFGDPGATYSVGLPASTTISNPLALLATTPKTMRVDTFKSLPDAAGTIGAGGSGSLNVGGTIHIQPQQTLGLYSGSVTITVSYN